MLISAVEGGRATSGLQGGEWRRAGSALDRLGEIGPDCNQVPTIRSNQGVCTYVPAVCFSGKEGEHEKEIRRRSEIQRRSETELGPGTMPDGSQTFCYSFKPCVAFVLWAINELPERGRQKLVSTRSLISLHPHYVFIFKLICSGESVAFRSFRVDSVTAKLQGS